MTIERQDILKLRTEWLKDIITASQIENPHVKRQLTAELKRMLISAEADLIELTDPEAAKVHRTLVPEW